MLKRVNKQQVPSALLYIRFFVLLGLIIGVADNLSMANSTSTKNGINGQGKAGLQQVFLTNEMIVYGNDLSSDNSAEFLIDEQTTSPETDLQPVSESWKPLAMRSDRYEVYFDLGGNHDLRQVLLHTVYSADGIEVSTGEPGDWSLVASSEGSDFNTWTAYNFTANARFLKLSMQKENVALINEVLLFAEEMGADQYSEKSADMMGIIEPDSDDLSNRKNLDIEYDDGLNNLKINIPPGFGHDFTIDIYNMNGYKVSSTEYVNYISAQLLLDLSRECDRTGVYIIHYYNDSGISKTVKFQKRR